MRSLFQSSLHPEQLAFLSIASFGGPCPRTWECDLNMKPTVRTPIIIAGLVLLSAIALSPVLQCGFIAMDDDLYVTNNPHVLGGITMANAFWFFTHSHEF